MSIASATSKSGPYAGNGVTTVFAVGFACFAATDLAVVRTDAASVDTTLVLTTDYSVALNADQTNSPGGTITMMVAPPTGYQLTVLRNVAATQGVQLPNQGGWYPQVVEKAFDKLTMIVQQLNEKISRAVVVGVAAGDPAALITNINTASGSATAASASASSASASAAAAALSAATVNVPSITGNALKALRAKANESGLEYFDSGNVTRSARTANAILTAADKGSFVDITAGTFTQTFTAPATLGAGWWCRLGNSGTGDITIPVSDGVTNWIMYPGEVRDFYTDGVVFTSRIVHAYRRDWLASGNWTKPPGYKAHGGLAWSGGPSGSRSNIALGGSAGGGSWPFTLNHADLGSTEPVTIGSGGAARTTDGNGNPGGDTSFGSWFTVFGGQYNKAGAIGKTSAIIQSAAASAVGFEGAPQSAVSYNSIYGGSTAASDASAASGFSIYGGAASGGVTGGGVLQTAGTSQFGGNGGLAGSSTNGVAGTAPGGAGGPTQTGAQSGAGARGEIRMWGIA